MKVFPSGGFQTSGFVWALFRELIPTAAVGWLGGLPFWTQLNNHTGWVWRRTKNSVIMVPAGMELTGNLNFSKKKTKKKTRTFTAYCGTHCQDEWDKWEGLNCLQPMKFMYFFIYDVNNEKSQGLFIVKVRDGSGVDPSNYCVRGQRSRPTHSYLWARFSTVGGNRSSAQVPVEPAHMKDPHKSWPRNNFTIPPCCACAFTYWIQNVSSTSKVRTFLGI